MAIITYATGGRKPRSLIVMKSNHVVLSALQTSTLKERLISMEKEEEGVLWTSASESKD